MMELLANASLPSDYWGETLVAGNVHVHVQVGSLSLAQVDSSLFSSPIDSPLFSRDWIID